MYKTRNKIFDHILPKNKICTKREIKYLIISNRKIRYVQNQNNEKNEIHKILLDFERQTDQLVQTKRRSGILVWTFDHTNKWYIFF